MKVEVLFFASARDRAGTAGAEIELPDGSDVAALIRGIVERHPELQPVLSSARFACNEEFVDTRTVLHHGDRVAWLPPMSGG